MNKNFNLNYSDYYNFLDKNYYKKYNNLKIKEKYSAIEIGKEENKNNLKSLLLASIIEEFKGKSNYKITNFLAQNGEVITENDQEILKIIIENSEKINVFSILTKISRYKKINLKKNDLEILFNLENEKENNKIHPKINKFLTNSFINNKNYNLNEEAWQFLLDNSDINQQNRYGQNILMVYLRGKVQLPKNQEDYLWEKSNLSLVDNNGDNILDYYLRSSNNKKNNGLELLLEAFSNDEFIIKTHKNFDDYFDQINNSAEFNKNKEKIQKLLSSFLDKFDKVFDDFFIIYNLTTKNKQINQELFKKVIEKNKNQFFIFEEKYLSSSHIIDLIFNEKVNLTHENINLFLNKLEKIDIRSLKTIVDNYENFQGVVNIDDILKKVKFDRIMSEDILMLEKQFLNFDHLSKEIKDKIEKKLNKELQFKNNPVVYLKYRWFNKLIKIFTKNINQKWETNKNNKIEKLMIDDKFKDDFKKLKEKEDKLKTLVENNIAFIDTKAQLNNNIFKELETSLKYFKELKSTEHAKIAEEEIKKQIIYLSDFLEEKIRTAKNYQISEAVEAIKLNSKISSAKLK